MLGMQGWMVWWWITVVGVQHVSIFPLEDGTLKVRLLKGPQLASSSHLLGFGIERCIAQVVQFLRLRDKIVPHNAGKTRKLEIGRRLHELMRTCETQNSCLHASNSWHSQIGKLELGKIDQCREVVGGRL